MFLPSHLTYAYQRAIPPKVAPVPENTVIALFTDISELIVVYSYLIFHSGL